MKWCVVWMGMIEWWCSERGLGGVGGEVNLMWVESVGWWCTRGAGVVGGLLRLP